MTDLAKKYKKLTTREHVLQRPGMYMGPIENEINSVWVPEGGKMVEKNIEYNPGIIKLVDEIITNASDHAREYNTVKNIKINVTDDTISVFNDGPGIEIEKHPEYGIYIPELIFANFLTSSNYNDSQKRLKGGMNGLGSKIVGTFSTSFTIETAKGGKKYTQTFENNLGIIGVPKITTSKSEYTKIIFKPDLKRFGINVITEGTQKLIEKRAYDLAACTDKRVHIFFNDEKIGVKDFKEYTKLYLPEHYSSTQVFIEQDRWKVAIMFSPYERFLQFSFVNGLFTPHGGKHVDHIIGPVLKQLTDTLKKKNENIKPAYLKENMMVFVIALIENPSFKSQSKEELTTPISEFGSRCEIDDKSIKTLLNSEICKNALEFLKFKESKELNQSDGKKKVRLTGIPKLEDANFSGTKQSQKCTLILTEGDSAKTFAVSGTNIIGRDYYGIFPLRGKLLNVRTAAIKKLAENEEIKNLKTILGLQNRKFKSTDELLKTMRYGKILILTDQDSVSGDTPLLLRRIEDGLFEIRTIDSLTDEFTKDDLTGKEYGFVPNYEIYTEKGFTSIKKIMRHKVSKGIHRIHTASGVVDVTEDHSVLLSTKQKICPRSVTTQSVLLHSYPSFEKVPIPENIFGLSEKKLRELAIAAGITGAHLMNKKFLTEALYDYRDIDKHTFFPVNEFTDDSMFVFGLFFGSGVAKLTSVVVGKKVINEYVWKFFHTNLAVMHDMKEKLINMFPNAGFEIKTSSIHEFGVKEPWACKDKIYKIIAHSSKEVTERFMDVLYIKTASGKYTTNKYINYKILNAENRKEFLKGLLKSFIMCSSLSSNQFVSIKGKLSSQCVFHLVKTLGYSTTIQYSHKNSEYYTITFSKYLLKGNHYKVIGNTILRRDDLMTINEKDVYVYDLHTENHHFHAGVGSLIVHNTDGSHIKGLLINFFDYFWPELLKDTNFINVLQTPIVKASKGKEVKIFYNLAEYEEFKKTIGQNWKIKYYKGLGTSTRDEAKECFKGLENKQAEFVVTDEYDKEAILLAFEKKREDQRKLWIQRSTGKQLFLDSKKRRVPLKDFFDNEFVNFSIYDCERSIPNLMDGLKPSQRKVLYGCLSMKLFNEKKVFELCGEISSRTAYHHGDTSLNETIIGMAQDFVGSNNINLLEPCGQFGSRLMGGEDAASPRYIFTKLNSVTRKIFKEEDDPLLTYNNDDGKDIEPVYYWPVIPMILINGSVGIGTGYSTNIPPHNPKEIIKHLKGLIKHGEDYDYTLTPWVRGFKGTIASKDDSDNWISRGVYKRKDRYTVEITELPVGMWTEKFTELLDKLLENNEITNYNNRSDDITVNFIITMDPAKLSGLIEEDKFYNFLKLESTIKSSNLTFFDHKCKLIKVKTTEEILLYFYRVRKGEYKTRYDHLVETLEDELEIIGARIEFVRRVIEQTLRVFRVPKQEIIQQLESSEFPLVDGNYDYLLSMKIYNFSKEKIEDLEKQHQETMMKLATLKKKTPLDLWQEDLAEIEKLV